MEAALIGQTFGRLTVECIADNGKRAYFWCVCSCGTRKTVRRDHLTSGKTTSCGCLKNEQASKRAGVMHVANITHGKSHSKAYSTWCGMRQRCNNPKSSFYEYYGGRGIYICERWNAVANFLSDMGEPELDQTIDRIDNDGPYSPENCRWVSRKVQQNNRRCNVTIEFEGRTQTLSQWAEERGINQGTIMERHRKGFGVDRLLSPEKFLDTSSLPAACAASLAKRMTKTHCINGHEYNEANLGLTKRGTRFCAECKRQRERERQRLLRKNGIRS